MVGVSITGPTLTSLPPALTASPWVVSRVTQSRASSSSVGPTSSVTRRTEKEWWDLLTRRCARLGELRALNAPDILIDQEKRLILDAQVGLSVAQALRVGLGRPS